MKNKLLITFTILLIFITFLSCSLDSKQPEQDTLISPLGLQGEEAGGAGRPYIWAPIWGGSGGGGGSGTIPPPASDYANNQYGSAVVFGDFDNNGYEDLVIGYIGINSGAGGIDVFPGISAGNMSGWAINQDSPGLNGMCEPGDHFGAALAVGRFNDDEFDDLAVGVPGEAIGSLYNAGMVNIIYGSATGLNSDYFQGWHQNSAGISSIAAEANDEFGYSLAVGDFDNNGIDDLAIGSPGESVGDASEAGMVTVLYGTTSGLSATGYQVWHQNIDGIDDNCSEYDGFGKSIVAGNFDGINGDDLAIGVPLEDLSLNQMNAGIVHILYDGGDGSGLSAVNSEIWKQDLAGIKGNSEDGDCFGFSLAAGRFNADNCADLAIGVPYETINFSTGVSVSTGSVNVIFGSTSGLTDSGDLLLNQNSTGVAEDCHDYDYFGYSLTVGRFNSDASTQYDDLVVGVPGEDLNSVVNAGYVNIFYGSATGLLSDETYCWFQGASDISGPSTADDWFGKSLAAGDFNNDGKADLAIGAPGKDRETADKVGIVHLVFGHDVGLNNSYAIPEVVINQYDFYQ